MNFTGLSELFLALLINSNNGFEGIGPLNKNNKITIQPNISTREHSLISNFRALKFK